jgi:hypothetical protein
MDGLVTVNQTLFGKAVANVLGFTNLQSDETWLQTFADNIRTLWSTHLSIHLLDNWSLDSITVAFINGGSISYSIEIEPSAGQLSGIASADGMPSTCALVCSLRSLGNIPSRGRVYFTGFNELAHNNSYWTTNVMDGCAAVLSSMRDGIGPSGSEAFLRIVGRPKPGRTNYVSSPVTHIIPRQIVATQRRRRLKYQ